MAQYATVRTPNAWEDDVAAARRGLGSSKGLLLGATMRMLAASKGDSRGAFEYAKEIYGPAHPIAKTIDKGLVAGVGSSGGFIIPPEQSTELIELLRPKTAVRAAEPILMPMAKGTMTLPSQTSAAVATYGSEKGAITQSQSGVGQVVATYKKLKSLVPISNDLIRFADPSADALVRNDLVQVMSLRQDLAFLTGDGTQDSPVGLTSYANRFAVITGGTAANWSSTAISTAGSGGNFVTSQLAFTTSSIVEELVGLMAKLAIANVPNNRRAWFMHERTFLTLAYGVYNSLGLQFFPDLAETKTLFGIPVFTSNQISINTVDPSGAYADCSFVMLAEMTEVLLLDSLALDLMVSNAAVYVDSVGATQSAFTNDETVVRAIAEHDLALRHNASVAVLQFCRWQPTMQ